MQIVGIFIIGGFILFIIIANAVKIAVKEALYEFKKEIIEEFDLNKFNIKDKDIDVLNKE